MASLDDEEDKPFLRILQKIKTLKPKWRGWWWSIEEITLLVGGADDEAAIRCARAAFVGWRVPAHKSTLPFPRALLTSRRAICFAAPPDLSRHIAPREAAAALVLAVEPLLRGRGPRLRAAPRVGRHLRARAALPGMLRRSVASDL